MSYFLLPISLFIKQIFETQSYHLNRIPIYFLILIILFAILFGKRTSMKYLFNVKVIIFICFFIGWQFIAMGLSYIDITPDIPNQNPVKQLILLVVLIACISIHYFAVQLIINSQKNINRFIKGNFIALVIVLIVSGVQFAYLISPNLFNNIVLFIGTFFENRVNRDWYDNGSYVQTLNRINGFNSEAGYLAVQLLIIFVPFILASIKNKYNIFLQSEKFNALPFYFLLLSIIFILFFAKTTTGIIAILLIVLFLWSILPFKRKTTLGVFLLIVFGTLVFWLKDNPLVIEILNNTLFNKGESSSQNRTGGTIALIKTWYQNFFAGIGWGYHDYYLLANVPDWSKNNFEYINVFSAENFYPILSVFFGWLSEFGTIVVTIAGIYIYKLLKDLRIVSEKAKAVGLNNAECKFIETLKDSAHYFIVFYLICSIFVFYWDESIYLIMFFFFVSVRQYYKQRLNEIEK